MSLHAKVEHISYTMGTRALPVYTHSPSVELVRIYQAKHSCPWYNYYIYIRQILHGHGITIRYIMLFAAATYMLLLLQGDIIVQ